MTDLNFTDEVRAFAAIAYPDPGVGCPQESRSMAESNRLETESLILDAISSSNKSMGVAHAALVVAKARSVEADLAFDAAITYIANVSSLPATTNAIATSAGSSRSRVERVRNDLRAFARAVDGLMTAFDWAPIAHRHQTPLAIRSILRGGIPDAIPSLRRRP